MTGDDEQPVPEQIRDAIEASDWPELSVREIMGQTGLTEDQVLGAAGSMDRLELDRDVGAVRLPEDPGGEFVDDHERLLPDGGEAVETCRGWRVFDLPRPQVEYRYSVRCPNCDRRWGPSIAAGQSRHAGSPYCPDCGTDFRAWIAFQRLFGGVQG